MIKPFHHLIALAVIFAVASCSKNGTSPNDDKHDDDDDGKVPVVVDDALHFSFKTPDWSRQLDCSRLDLSGQYVNDSLRMATAESESTKELFRLPYPGDSSAMARPQNIKKYKINDYAQYQTGAFQFSQRLPVNYGSNTVLFSKDGLSESSFNEVVSIKYAGSTAYLAYFNVKGRYSMTMYDRNNPNSTKLVTGTYHFKVGTYKR